MPNENLTNVQCKRCEKLGEEGDVLFTKDGAYIDRFVGTWYWSDYDECWYCKPCEREIVAEKIKGILSICKEKDIKCVDFQGNNLLEDE